MKKGDCPHFGAPGYHDGWIYVPIQLREKARGVWRFRADGTQQEWRKADVLPEGNLFAWCAIHPVTGVLYTCNYDRPSYVRAYDRETVAYRRKDDFPLSPTLLDLDKVQGGALTPRGRVLLVRWDFGAIFCFSSLNGCFCGDLSVSYPDTWFSEIEGVTVRDWCFNRASAQVHILERNIEVPDMDWVNVHSYQVPEPECL